MSSAEGVLSDPSHGPKCSAFFDVKLMSGLSPVILVEITTQFAPAFLYGIEIDIRSVCCLARSTGLRAESWLIYIEILMRRW